MQSGVRYELAVAASIEDKPSPGSLSVGTRRTSVGIVQLFESRALPSLLSCAGHDETCFRDADACLDILKGAGAHSCVVKIVPSQSHRKCRSRCFIFSPTA